MRSFIFATLSCLGTMANPSLVQANDAIEECKAFFTKFERCIDGLKGDQQDQARIFLRTIKATLGMSNDLNQGDPMYTGIMCKLTIQEIKKDQSVQTYNCQW
jgi:hypothetical protein